MCLNHPETNPSMETLSSMKPVPGAKNLGDCCPIELKIGPLDGKVLLSRERKKWVLASCRLCLG